MQTKTESTTQDTTHPEAAGAERLADLKKAASEHFSAGVDLVTKAIKEHPLVAVGIGFGIGYVLARILHRD
jgi:hypothetical protein